MSARLTLTTACVLGFAAVLLGAFGAHGLTDSGYLEKKYADFEPKQIAGLEVPAAYKYLQDFKTAVRYHMWHALLLFGLGIAASRQPSKLLATASVIVTLGTVIFSGALYILVIAGPRAAGIPWGLVAPIGGSLLMAGWIVSAIAVTKRPSESAKN